MPLNVSISVETQSELRHAFEAIWAAVQAGQAENSIVPYKLRGYDILVRRGEGDDYGAVSLEREAA